ncbi:hypothetical protein PJ900_03985 (plasmid) [Tistrella mobilis]|uniref:hypothetical protein n=1 Tax=Tistrella mobilis TaxID=171437 RepID=UPI00078926E4|nr:hypothetical protein [Tistrella mobilis]
MALAGRALPRPWPPPQWRLAAAQGARLRLAGPAVPRATDVGRRSFHNLDNIDAVIPAKAGIQVRHRVKDIEQSAPPQIDGFT